MKITTLFSIFFLLFFVSTQAQKAPSMENIVGAQVGDTVTDFTLTDQNGEVFTLGEVLKKGPVVLVFYRGQWCPYCNKYLSNLQDSLPIIAKKGAIVVALSPENPEYLKKMKEKTEAHFTLLYDSAYQVARAMDVLFDPGEQLTHKYDRISGKNLDEVHGTKHVLLPIPATFVIGTNGVILWRHFEPNYKERPSVSDIIRALP